MSDAFPLDFAALEKGQCVERERIERIFQVKRADDPERFRLGQMRLVEMIEKERRDLYPRCEGDTVRIMNDAEAEEYNGRRHKSHVEGIVRDARRRSRIDRTQFNDAERRAAESRDLSYSALALMSRRALAKADREALLLGPKTASDDE